MTLEERDPVKLLAGFFPFKLAPTPNFMIDGITYSVKAKKFNSIDDIVETLKEYVDCECWIYKLIEYVLEPMATNMSYALP